MVLQWEGAARRTTQIRISDRGVCSPEEVEASLRAFPADFVLYHRVPWERAYAYDGDGRRVNIGPVDKQDSLNHLQTRLQLSLCYSPDERRQRYMHFAVRRTAEGDKLYVDTGDALSSAAFSTLDGLLRHHSIYAYFTGDSDTNFIDSFQRPHHSHGHGTADGNDN